MVVLGLVLIAAVGVIIVGTLFLYVLKLVPKSSEQDIYLQKSGIRAKGKIVAVAEVGKKLKGTSYPMVKLTVEIYLSTAELYTSSIVVPVSYRSFPSAGMPVKVLVNPNKKEEFIFGE